MMGVYVLLLIVGALNIGNFGSLLKLLAVVPIAVWILEKHSFYFNILLKCAIPFALWCFLSVVWSINFQSSFDRATTQILFVILLLSVSGYHFNNTEIRYTFKCLIWSSRITAFFVLLSADYLPGGRLYLGGAIREDPNYLCAYFMFAVVFDVMILLSVASTLSKKAIGCVELAIYLYIVLATGSRGGLFALIAAVSIILLFYRDRSQSIGNSLYKRILFIAALFLAFSIVQLYISEDVLLRYSYESISESNGTGRYELWKDAISAFDHSTLLRQLVGYGTGTARDITYLFPFYRHNVFHNIYIENLLEIGIIGICFYIVHIFSFVIYVLRRGEIYPLAILAGMIVLSLSTSLYAFKPFWNILIYILILNQSNEKSITELG